MRLLLLTIALCNLGLRKEYFWIEVYCFVCSFYLGTFESPKSLSIEEQ